MLDSNNCLVLGDPGAARWVGRKGANKLTVPVTLRMQLTRHLKCNINGQNSEIIFFLITPAGPIGSFHNSKLISPCQLLYRCDEASKSILDAQQSVLSILGSFCCPSTSILRKLQN